MRVYLTIISFILFICTVSSRSVSSFSDEDNSNEIRQETNRRNMGKTLLLARLRSLLDDDDENTNSQFVQEGNQFDEDDDDDDTDNDNAIEDVRKKRLLSDDDEDDNDDGPNNINEEEEAEVEEEVEEEREPILRDAPVVDDLNTNEFDEEPINEDIGNQLDETID